MNKLRATAKKLDTFFKIIQTVFTILIVATSVCLGIILLGYVCGWSTEDFGTNYEILDLAFLELHIVENFAPDKWLVLLEAAIMLALGLVCVVIGRKGIQCIRAILHPMTEGRPFNGVASANLKKLAVLGILLGIASNGMLLAGELLMVHAYDLPGILISEKISHVTVNYSFDFTFLLYSAVLLLLSYVFRYGEELQQLSDETL